jgi:hypothetical protein
MGSNEQDSSIGGKQDTAEKNRHYQIKECVERIRISRRHRQREKRD